MMIRATPVTCPPCAAFIHAGSAICVTPRQTSNNLPMVYVSASNRAADVKYFNNLCAYCKSRLHPGHHYDHVRPKAKGGSNEHRNLVPVCSRCNTAKSDTWTPIRDPYRGAEVAWFDPREEVWHHHFKFVRSEVVGVSPTGRATCAVLFRPLSAPSTSLVSFAPSDVASDIALVETIVWLIAEQQEGRYGQSLRAPTHLSSWIGSDRAQPGDRWLADFAAHWLPTMARWKRGTARDLHVSWQQSLRYYRRGRLVNEPPHAERFRLEWVATNAILLATLYEVGGDTARSVRFREFAANVYSRVGADPLIGDPLLAWRSVSNQMVLQQDPVRIDTPTMESIAQQEESLAFQVGGDWVDAIVRSGNETPYSVIEAAWEIVDRMMQVSTYGAGGDLAQSVGLRRRWWLLQFRLVQPIDMDLLYWDVRYWARNRLRSEIRLLLSDLSRLKVQRDVLATIFSAAQR